MAFRVLGIDRIGFWGATPAELGEMLAGASWREEQRWRRVAWETAHLVNVSGKTLRRTITADELLGKPRKVVVRDPMMDFNTLWARLQKRAKEAEETQAGDEEGTG